MNQATYSPEDNKLRLYVGRVPRDEYEKLRAEGWTSTPKQNCQFVAHWTPARRDTALEYAGIIEDEDQGPAERAADRAERFAGYLEKRTSEATGHADRYDATPPAHGYQSHARAERSAAKHDRIASRACDAWSKAEYWQQRTAGVISHALHLSTPAVRMGRIKTLEAELRGMRASIQKRLDTFKMWQSAAAQPDTEQQNKQAKFLADYEHGEYTHPATGAEMSLYKIAEDCSGAEVALLWLSKHREPALENDWTQHLAFRLAYENQMCEAAGGRAALVEMVVGGWIGNYQIRKVNKSNATGLVVSVQVLAPGRFSDSGKEVLRTLNIERLKTDVYRAPTAEDIAKLEATKAAEKAAAPRSEPCPLINPTDEDAEQLQELWNERARAKHNARNIYDSPEARAIHDAQFKPATVCRITQATYSANSKGAYCKAKTERIEAGGKQISGYKNFEKLGNPVCLLRATPGEYSHHQPDRVIVLTDKPQKPLPAAVWEKPFALETVNA